jgi:hypothetical protein
MEVVGLVIVVIVVVVGGRGDKFIRSAHPAAWTLLQGPISHHVRYRISAALRGLPISIARQLSSLEPGLPLLSPSVAVYLRKEAEGFASGTLHINESCALIIQLIEHYPLTTIVIPRGNQSPSRDLRSVT